MRFAYVSPNVNGDAQTATHIDPLRWGAFYRGFLEIGADVEPINIRDFVDNPAGLKAAFSNAPRLLLHNEFAVRRVIDVIGYDEALALFRASCAHLQVDLIIWKYLGLDAPEIMPAFRTVACAAAAAAAKRGIPHIPLGCARNTPMFDERSDTVLYLGRYDVSFNERTRSMAHLLARLNLRLCIVTYPEDQRALAEIMPDCKNIELRDPIPYGRLSAELPRVRFGVAFKRHLDPNGKVWDYLGMQVPVLYEFGISEAEMLAQSGAGIGFDHGRIDDLEPAIGAFSAPDMAAIREQNSWAQRAQQWMPLLAA